MRISGYTMTAMMAVVSASAAQADRFDPSDWYRRAIGAVESLMGKPNRGDVIAPAGNIDPKMALVPPPNGTTRVIMPPEAGGRRP